MIFIKTYNFTKHKEGKIMNKKEIIHRISSLRTKANLSARELSLRAGLNAGYVNRLETSADEFSPSIYFDDN